MFVGYSGWNIVFFGAEARRNSGKEHLSYVMFISVQAADMNLMMD